MLFPLNSLIPFLYTIVSMGLYKSHEAITFHLPSQLELESSTKTPKHQLIPLASQRCLKCRSKRCLINWHGSIHKWIKILAWKIHMKNAQTHSATTSKVLKCVYSVEMCCLHILSIDVVEESANLAAIWSCVKPNSHSFEVHRTFHHKIKQEKLPQQ